MYFRHHACSLSIAYLRCCDGDAIIHRFCVCEVVFFKLGANGRPAFLYRQNRRRYHKPVVPTGDRFAPRSSHPDYGLDIRPVLTSVGPEHVYAALPPRDQDGESAEAAQETNGQEENR